MNPPSSFPSSGQLAPNPVTKRTYFPSRGWVDEHISALQNATVLGKEKSTIARQERTPRFDAEYNPLEIMFLSGKYKGMVLDIGLNVQEFGEAQSADWSDAKGTNIKVGSNFTKIMPRTFNIKFEYSDLREDIRQLTEAVSHTQELDDEKTWTPPLLRMLIGKTSIAPVVCTQFDVNYDEPLPGKRGFRHSVVSMSLKEIAGQGSKSQLGAPLVSSKTALQQYAADTSERDKAAIGQNKVTQVLLAPCLGEEASAKIASLTDNKQLDDAAALLSLSPEIFLNMVVAGLIGTETLKNPQIAEKLKRDLAEKLAKDSPGMNPVNIRITAEALYLGNPSALPASLNMPIPGTGRSPFDKMLAQYQAILDAMQTQKLDETDPIFGKSTFDENQEKSSIEPGAAGTMIDSFGCAISLRRSGTPALATKPVESDSRAIAGINQALANPKLSDQEVAAIFKLPADTPETVTRQLRNGGPYKSREDFLQKLANSRNGVTGYVLWQNFEARDKENLGKINEFLTKENLTDDEIKKAFGVNDKEVAIVRNGGKPFKSKQEFLDKMAKAGSSPDPSRGYQAWESFWKNNSK
jgi:hypothetical protein